MFVKPANRGGGLGIDSDSVVKNFMELKSKVNYISKKFNSDSLIEKYLPGREFSVAILKNKNNIGYTGMPLELIAPENEKGQRLLGSNVKSADAEHVKEVTDAKIRESIIKLAIDAFRSIGGRDYGRIDIRMDEHGVPHFLEANLIPSLIDNYGSFPKACALNQQISYEDMLLRITNLGMSRPYLASESQESTLYHGVAFG
jgi:D-alanine-D-alanine ligase